MASYLLNGMDQQEVFSCFKFVDIQTNKEYPVGSKIDRRFKDLFSTFVKDARLPPPIRKLCGDHMGRTPGLGVALDLKVFEYLWSNYILHNETCNDTSKIKKRLPNDQIRDAVQKVLKNATEEELEDVTFTEGHIEMLKQEIPGFDVANPKHKRLFMYRPDALTAFKRRWFIDDYGKIDNIAMSKRIADNNSRGTLVPQSAYAISRNYPVDGYDIPDNFDDFTLSSGGESLAREPTQKTKKIIFPGGAAAIGAQLLKTRNTLLALNRTPDTAFFT